MPFQNTWVLLPFNSNTTGEQVPLVDMYHYKIDRTILYLFTYTDDVHVD